MRIENFEQTLRKMAKNQAEQNIPLTEKDREALDAIFAKIEVDAMSQIDAMANYSSVAPLEPWEEMGWIINSSFQNISGLMI